MEFLFPKEEGTTRVRCPTCERSSHEGRQARFRDVTFDTNKNRRKLAGLRNLSLLGTLWLKSETQRPRANSPNKNPTGLRLEA